MDEEGVVYGLEEVAGSLNRIANGLHSPNEVDANGEIANVVDGLYAISRGLFAVARAIHSLKAESEGEGR